MPEKIDGYLQFLDREMTIMGILSGFCLTVLSLGLKALLSDKQGQLGFQVWEKEWLLLLASAVLLLAAAYLFYEQRSCLAWHYGTIAYFLATGREAEALSSLKELQDSREEWSHYFFAHGAMILAFAALVLALGRTIFRRVEFVDMILPLILLSSTICWVLVVFVRQRIEKRKMRRRHRKLSGMSA
jgi:hypothetical protein